MYTDYRQVPDVHPPCVYMLVDPRTPNAPRYLGSSRALRVRLKGHHKPFSASRNERFAAWFSELVAAGVRPAMRVVAVYETEAQCRSAEWKIAARWKRRGIALTSTHVPPVCDTSLYYAQFGWAGALAEVRRMRDAA